MHFAVEMIRQSSIVIQPAQIRPAHVANLKLLVPAWPRRIRKGTELALFLFLGSLGGSDLIEFCDGGGDGARFAEDGDFEESSIYSAREVGDLFELCIDMSAGFLRAVLKEQSRVLERSFVLFRPVFSQASSAQRQCVDCIRRCTSACRACSHIRNQIYFCLQ